MQYHQINEISKNKKQRKWSGSSVKEPKFNLERQLSVQHFAHYTMSIWPICNMISSLFFFIVKMLQISQKVVTDAQNVIRQIRKFMLSPSNERQW